MKEKIVKTIKGVEAEEKNCRLIDGEYYLIGDNKVENSGDIYLINNRYIRFSTDRIVFDCFEHEYKLKNASLVYGIIGINEDKLIYGYFTRNDLYNVRVLLKDSNEAIAIAYNVLGYMFRERKSDGVFYHISLLEANRFNQLRGISREIKESFPYDSKGSIAKVTKSFETYYKPVISPAAEKIGLALKNYTFGLEFETTAGIIPNNKLNFLPLIPLRDGSISGIEYATIPLQGPRGLQALIDSVDELKRRTSFSDECSLHLHVGGLPRTIEHILAFYKVISLLQNDIFTMFPLYKKYNFGVKRKNYSAPFPFEEINFRMDPVINWNDKKALVKNFDPLFTYLSGGISFSEFNNDLNQVIVHPQDPQGNAKWNIKHRYSFVNLIPLIFGNHQTIEFRIHTPTYDINKIVNFLMINTFIIDYVALNYKRILANLDNLSNRRASLLNMLESYVNSIPENSRKMIFNELVHYISDRKAMSEDLARSKGVVYQEEDMRLNKQIRLTTYQYKKRVVEEPSKASWDPWEVPSWSYSDNPFDGSVRFKSSGSGVLGTSQPKKKLTVKPPRRTGKTSGEIPPPSPGLYEQMKHSQALENAVKAVNEAIKMRMSDSGPGIGIQPSSSGEIRYTVGTSETSATFVNKEPGLQFKEDKSLPMGSDWDDAIDEMIKLNPPK